MGKRYHCEYCNKSFPYTVAMRKKHDAGLVHQKLKDAHYRQFAGCFLYPFQFCCWIGILDLSLC